MRWTLAAAIDSVIGGDAAIHDRDAATLSDWGELVRLTCQCQCSAGHVWMVAALAPGEMPGRRTAHAPTGNATGSCPQRGVHFLPSVLPVAHHDPARLSNLKLEGAQ